MEERLVEALERAAVALERAAAAQEQLNGFVTEEREFDAQQAVYGPATCPHCGIEDPQTRSKGGEGRFSDFVLGSECGTCGGMMYGIPLAWKVVGSAEEARKVMTRE